jgi:hypothetical protein
MWDEQQRSRFEQLRQAQQERALTDAEQTELTSMVCDIEALEAAYLQPSTDRIRQERLNLAARNRRLEIVAGRQEALALRLRNFLAETAAERRAIKCELAEVVAGSQGSKTDE